MPNVLSVARCMKLGGETDSAIRRRKRTGVTLLRGREGSWLLRTYLKPSLKMSSTCCKFRCYNRKLCVNKAIGFFP